MLFAVIPLDADKKGQIKALTEKVESAHLSVYEKELPDVLFLSFSGSIGHLMETLGFGDDEKVGTGLNLRVTHRNGFADRDLWEWLDNHE